MAFKDSSSDIVISDAGELLHKTFNRLSGTIQSTMKSIYISDFNNAFATTLGDPQPQDQFGYSVAVGSGKIVVGVPGDDLNTTLSGSASVFDLNGNVLALFAEAAGASDRFGRSVAVGSGRIVVGVPKDGYFADPAAGSIYVFDLNAKGIPSFTYGPTYMPRIFAGTPDDQTDGDVDAGDEFGHSVAVGSSRIVVGAPYNNDTALGSGSAYIYDLTGRIVKKIVASDAANADYFGWSVAVGCGRIVVGAPYNDDTAQNAGSAYIFDLDGNLIKKIVASDAAGADQFGNSVAVGSGRIVVGAPFDDDTASNTGSAYIFDLDGTQLEKIVASDAATGDNFGYSVAVGSSRIVVGSPLDNTGSAYVYDRDGTQIEKLTAGSDAVAGDHFGYSVAVGSSRIVVGAPFHGLTSASGAVAADSGAAYIFDLDENYDTYIERQLGY
jgi:hypothetical protein